MHVTERLHFFKNDPYIIMFTVYSVLVLSICSFPKYSGGRGEENGNNCLTEYSVLCELSCPCQAYCDCDRQSARSKSKSPSSHWINSTYILTY